MLETERLILRPHATQDVDMLFRLVRDPAVLRFIRGLPSSREEAWHRLLRHAGHWSLLGYGMFAVFERRTGSFIGEVGLADFQRGLGLDFDGAPEAAWLLAGAAHGRGLGLEAMSAALKWFDASRPDERTVCIIGPENTASIRLADRLGFIPYSRGRYRDADVVKLERMRPGNS